MYLKVAQEERDALVELERKRLKRMKDDIDEDGEEGAKPARKKGRVSFSDVPEGDEADQASSKKSKKGKEEEEEESVATQHDDLPYTFEMPTKVCGYLVLGSSFLERLIEIWPRAQNHKPSNP